MCVCVRARSACFVFAHLFFSQLEKCLAGFVFAAAAMVVAGFVEIERKNAPFFPVDDDDQAIGCAPAGIAPSHLSVYWQVPQYMLIGTAEILIAIPSYDLFYNEVCAPPATTTRSSPRPQHPPPPRLATPRDEFTASWSRPLPYKRGSARGALRPPRDKGRLPS